MISCASATIYTDHITDIEVNPREISLITAKVGPVNTLRIKIDLVDLRDGRNITVYNLSGPILQFSRGRYSMIVGPDRWYGIVFQSENVYESDRYQHVEEKLVRTPPDRQISPRLGVKVLFENDDEHIENVILQAKWIDKETRLVQL
uniref:DUF2141 domain-containing protein n=1 Tax=Syphacia muris TaxID=451379 RepID=A0A0N5ARK6_9BILA